MLQSGMAGAGRVFVNTRNLLILVVLAVVGSVLPTTPVAAAGDAVLSVNVTILDGAGVPVSSIDPNVVGTYSVNVAYSCSVAPCDNTTVTLPPTPLDPYYGAYRKESSFTVTPPIGTSVTTSGTVNTGITVNLGNVAVGTSASLKVNYRVDGTAGTVAGNQFFPNGAPIEPQVTVASPTAVAPVTGSASATWVSVVPEPHLQPFAPDRTRTDTDIVVETGFSNSGCVARGGGVWGSLPGVMCASAYEVTLHLPDNAVHVSGGSYDPGTRNVTWSDSGNTGGVAAGYGAANTPVVVNFPSDQYPTTDPGCIVNETFDFTYTITYLNGTVKTVTGPKSVEVQNCTPFAKASMIKTALAGTTSPVTVFPVPPTPGSTRTVSWRVEVRNQANVPGVATIVDDTLDLDDLPVHEVQIGQGGPATVTYTLDNGTTGTVTVNQGAKYIAPTGRRIVAVTATSAELLGPNTLPTQNASTPFVVIFNALLPWDATPGLRTNTATATMAYPDFPELDPVELEAQRTVDVQIVTAVGANALNITPQLGSPPVTPVAGSEIPWVARGQYSNVGVGSTLRPQYVFIAPAGWNIVPDGATMEATAPAGITFTYRTVVVDGVTRQAVIADWPSAVGQTGTVTLPSITVRTVPTTAAVPGTNNQSATLLVGDAENGDFASFSSSTYTDSTDIDDDGLATERFARRNALTNLAPTSAVGALKEICRPDPSATDGCDWIADSSVRVGVPPDATSIKYRVTIQNLGNATLNNVVGYDILPYVGDTGITTATASTPRGSTAAAQVTDVSDIDAGLTLTYSTSTNPPRPEVYTGSTTGTFTTTAAGARAIRMAVAALPAGESRSFLFEAGLVGGAADQVACNSVAVTAATLAAIEPAAVCATTQEADFSITDDDRYPLQEGRAGLVPFIVNQGGGSQLASGVVTIDVPADVNVGDLTLTPDWRCESPVTTGPVTVTCVPVNPDTTTRQLPIDVPETINLQVIPGPGTAGDALCFDAVVDGLIHDPEPTNNQVTACSQVVAAGAGISVSKDDGITIVAPGAETTYTIDVANTLTAETVTGAVLTDTLPTNATFVDATPAPATATGGVLTWNLGDLAPAGTPGDGDDATGGAGSTHTVTVTVAVSPSATGTVVNTATVTAPDPATGDDLTATDDDSDTVQSAVLSLTKTASPAGVNAVDDVITYTFVVHNTGNVALNGVTIDDPMFDAGEIDCGGVTTLADGADLECTATYAATAADFAVGQIVNTATATGQPAVGPAAESPEATATVVAEAAPRIDLAKAADEGDFDAAGDTLHFTLVVTNSGNVAVTGLEIADQLPGTAPVVCLATSLAPGGSTTCSTTYTATQADVDAGGVTNVATATATAANGAPTTSTPAEVTVPSVRNGDISLAKTAVETSFDAAGTVLNYRFVVTNDGNVTLTNIAIADGQVDDLSCPSATLPVGQSMTCAATYLTTADDVNDGGVTNTATVTADAPDGPVDPATDNVTVPSIAQPAIAIVKTVADTQLDAAGQVLDYTFVVTNTGNVTLTDVRIDDPMPDLSPIDCVGVTTLDPGESVDCTATYTVTQDNIDNVDQLVNTATAWGTPPTGPEIPSQPDTASVPPVVLPELTLVKTASTTTFDAPGTPITFEFEVTNTGNVTIENLQINDPLPGVGPATCELTVLAPGQATTCEATGFETTQAHLDHGGVLNTATASGETPSGAAVVSEIAELDIDAEQTPAATLVKGGAADQGDVDTVGEQVTFTFDVHNTGNITLTGIALIDDLPGVSAVSCPTNVLVPDAEMRCTATYTVTQADLNDGVIHNEAELAASQLPEPVQATFDLDAVQNGAIALDKIALTASYDGPDQTLEFEFVVTNTGNVELTGLIVSDPLPGMSAITCPATTLAPAESTTCAGTYTTTQTDVDFGSVINTAAATATAAGGTTPTAEDTATVDADQNPDIELTKTADAADGRFDAAGVQVTYTLTVVNTGNVTLSDVDVTELLPGASAPDACDVDELAPGGEVICEVTYTTTQQNVDGGGFTNEATVTATAPGGTPVSDTASAPLVAVQAPGSTFTKSAADGGFDSAGDVVTFTLTVANTGNVTLTDIEIIDALPGVTVDCPTNVLAPQDDPLVCEATYTVTQHDLDTGFVTNDAHLTATAPGVDEPWEQDASATVIGTQTASVQLVKSAQEPTFGAPGQTLHYRFAVTNTGNVTLTDVAVIDPLDGLSTITCPDTTLAPGASTTCTATYSTTQDDVEAGRVVNTATATATGPTPIQGPAPIVSADSTVTVPAVQSPGLSLVKTVEETSFTAGTTLHYRFTVTNTGNVTVTDLSIDDPMPGLSAVTCEAATLAPGVSTTCTATYIATPADVAAGTVTNTATAVGTGIGTDALESAPSSVDVDALVTPPTIPTIPPTIPTTPPTAPPTPVLTGDLPSTGGSSTQTVTVAAVVLLVGLVVLASTRRRRSPA
ncbi:MAG TPA: LPXTG cell wall anchor domain-containing protein [Ilumatobacter sp.]|nr:LPXTG cell wall anchor domain-containing protein [Ilumatobacter sp.]